MRGIRLKIALGLTVLFFSGVVIGAVGATVFIIRKVEHAFDDGPRGVRNLMLDGLQRDLSLTSEQREKADEIIERAQTAIAVERMSIHDAVRARIEESFQELLGHLTPEQQQLAKPLHKKMMARYDSMKQLAVRPVP